MGWKSFKEFYRIVHIVHITEEGLCIGSPHIHNIIVVAMDGTIIKRPTGSRNGDLARYQTEIDGDAETAKSLLEHADKFDASIPVFTYEGAEIIEKLCEKAGFPNVTHDGELMYENTFSTDKDQVIEWAKSSATGWVMMLAESISQARSELAVREKELKRRKRVLGELNLKYPR